MNSVITIESIVLLMTVTVLASIFYKINISSVVAYLLGGALLGENGLNIIRESNGINFLAELGVLFLMFIVGLELSIDKIKHLHNRVFFNGGLQLIFCSILVVLVLLIYGLSLKSAIVISLAIAMSSTALIHKTLFDQHDINTVHGRDVMGVLLFQDIMVAPIATVAVALESNNPDMGSLQPYLVFLFTFARLFFFVTLYYFIGKYLFVKLIKWIINTKSEDLKLLMIISLIIASGCIANKAGLSLPIGAFLVGIILSETEFKSLIENDMKPFRNVLIGIFFVTLGMKFNYNIFFNKPELVLITLLCLTIIKSFVIFCILKFKGGRFSDALLSATILGHGGEFTLLLISYANIYKILDQELTEAIICATIISMVLASIIIPRLSSLNCPRRTNNVATDPDNSLARDTLTITPLNGKLD